MRASFIAIFATLLIASSVFFIACDRSDDDGDDLQDRIRSPHDDIEDLVVFGGDIEITVDDVDKAVHRLRLLAPGVAQGQIPEGDPDWMQNPMTQINVVRQLLRYRIIRKATAERGIEITAADETSFLANHDPLKRYLPVLQNGDEAETLRQELAAVDLDIDDVRHLVHDMVLEKKLQEQLAQEFSDERLWAMYEQVYDEADIIVVSIANTPRSYEIDRAVEQYDSEIRTYYRENRHRYTRPRRVEATLLHATEDLSVLQEAAQRLADGEAPQKVAEELDLRLESDVGLNPKSDPEAYEADTDGVGLTKEGPRGPHVWMIDDVEEAHTRQLDRSLRREIGSQVLRKEEGITPANREQAQKAREILSDIDASGPLDEEELQALLKKLEEEDFDALHTDFFSVHGSGVIPQIGLSENLFEAIGQLDFDDPVTDPVLDRNDVRVARLVGRNYPDREAFEQDYDQFRDEFIEANRHRMVDDFVRNYQLEREVSFHLAALGDRYGTPEVTKPTGPLDSQEPVPAEEILEMDDDHASSPGR